jgi:hypothetical protein
MAATATKTPAKVDVDLMFLLSQASHALETEMTAQLQALGISPRAHCVLTHALSGELTQSQVAERCALDKTTMVVTMDELERAGLAERRPSSTDRRARRARPARRRSAFHAGEVRAPRAPPCGARAVGRSVQDRPERNHLLRFYLVLTNQETNR